MTNPNDAIGTNAGLGGRTSPNAFNDGLAAWSRGIMSGWACSPKSGMTVQLGGDGSSRDVAVAEDNAGNRTTINNRSGAPVDITIGGAPATGSRIDSIVAYVENPAQASSTDVDYAPASGIIAVQGAASGSPSAPTEANIRTAITADGADGTSAYYVVLADITVGQGVTTIGSGVIAAGPASKTAFEQSLVAQGVVLAKREVIYYNNGTIATGNVQISKALSNFDYFEVEFRASTNQSGEPRVQIFPSSMSLITLTHDHAGGSNTMYANYLSYTISGTTLTRGNAYQKAYASSALSTSGSTGSGIVKITGIKYIAL